ncbi:MAG: hypothetical protein LLG13_05610 [Bacteroidales bacterium]|nr:hypothetical protein [Bacteroidales bacterium]
MRFQEAVLYAKSAIANEVTKEAYKASAEEGETAYNVAVADFLNAPLINEIDVSHYNGQPDSYIQVRAVDDSDVIEVTVTIQNSDGKEVESGAAVLKEGSIWWCYPATVNNESLEGDKIIIHVSDIPETLLSKKGEFNHLENFKENVLFNLRSPFLYDRGSIQLP